LTLFRLTLAFFGFPCLQFLLRLAPIRFLLASFLQGFRRVLAVGLGQFDSRVAV
jgi:hypothetical protein